MKDKTLFEKLFSYHVSQIELLYGEEKCRSYVKEANDWLVSFLWLLGMSCFVVVMTIADISSLSGRSISKLLLFSLFLLWLFTCSCNRRKYASTYLAACFPSDWSSGS